MYSEQGVYKGVVKNYNKICPTAKTLVFSSTIESSKQITNEFIANGLDAKHLDSENFTKAERKSILEWYEKTPSTILCNVGILTTGFDSPTTQCVILYRATKSLPLFLQMCGRGARVTENKKTFHILDFGNNCQKHYFWEDERSWTLKKKKKKEGGAAPIKECPSCSKLLRLSAKECDNCGHVFEKQRKTPKEIELELLSNIKKSESHKSKSELLKSEIDKVVLMVKAGLLKASYVIYNRFTSYQKALEFTRMLGYKDGWLFYQKQNGNFLHLI